MKQYLIAGCAVFAVSACGIGGYKDGVGFTGIDGEPQLLNGADGTPGGVSRFEGIPQSLATLPPIALRTDSTTPSDLAGVAIDNGGQTEQTAVPIGIGEQEFMLSMVQVNGQDFGVLKLPGNGRGGKLTEGMDSYLQSSAVALTGCVPQGGVFMDGRSIKRSKGLAVALNCS